MGWGKVVVLALVTVGGCWYLFRSSRQLTVFATGEETAMRLGIDTERLKRWTLFVGTAITAVAVSAVGIIGFVGLFVPHIAWRLFGPDLRVSIPGSFLIVSGGVVEADVVVERVMWVQGKLDVFGTALDVS